MDRNNLCGYQGLNDRDDLVRFELALVSSGKLLVQSERPEQLFTAVRHGNGVAVAHFVQHVHLFLQLLKLLFVHFRGLLLLAPRWVLVRHWGCCHGSCIVVDAIGVRAAFVFLLHETLLQS